MGAQAAHRRRRLPDDCPPPRCGTRSRTRRGPAPIPACSTTPRSTSGTPAPPTAASTQVIPCSEYLFLDDTACNLASINLAKFLQEDGSVRRRGLPPRVPAVDDGARDQRADGRLPEPGHRAAELGLPDARPRLRQHGHGAHAPGHPVRLPGGHRHLRRHHRRHARGGVRDLGGDGEGPGPVPRLREEPLAHAAGDAQPPARRLQRAGLRIRGAHHHARGDRPGPLPGPAARGGAPDVGPRGRPRRDARLPERPGHRAGADRHHRPGHGLRHDGHRARFRPGQVQEAGRRRLLQDHQPEHPGGAPAPWLQPVPGRRRRRLLRRARHAEGRARTSTTRASAPRASTKGGSPASRRRWPARSTSRSPSTRGPSARATSPRGSG